MFRIFMIGLYTSGEDLRNVGSTSLRGFFSDYESKQDIVNENKKNSRYLHAELPKLPSDDKSFDLMFNLQFSFLLSQHALLFFSP